VVRCRAVEGRSAATKSGHGRAHSQWERTVTGHWSVVGAVPRSDCDRKSIRDSVGMNEKKKEEENPNGFVEGREGRIDQTVSAA
jgi:hypothetical protein